MAGVHANVPEAPGRDRPLPPITDGDVVYLDSELACLGTLAVFQPLCFFRVVWQLDTERVLQIDDFLLVGTTLSSYFRCSRDSYFKGTVCDWHKSEVSDLRCPCVSCPIQNNHPIGLQQRLVYLPGSSCHQQSRRYLSFKLAAFNNGGCTCLEGEMAQWLEHEFTDRKIRDSNPTSASRLPLSRLRQPGSIPALGLKRYSVYLYAGLGARWPKWLERESTDRKVRGSNPASASRLPLSRLGQPGSILALVLPSGGMAARHRKGATAERFFMLVTVRDKYFGAATVNGEDKAGSVMHFELNSVIFFAMEVAFELAMEALDAGEVPVGCVFIRNGTIIAKGRNEVNATKCAIEHAEMVAIRRLEQWCMQHQLSLADTLRDSELYVTVEPCIMCASALRFCLPAHPKRIVYGAKNERFGGCGSVFSIHDSDSPTTPPLICVSGIQEARAVSLLKQFYTQENPNAPQELRKSKPCAKNKASLNSVVEARTSCPEGPWFEPHLCISTALSSLGSVLVSRSLCFLQLTWQLGTEKCYSWTVHMYVEITKWHMKMPRSLDE
ncbi:tRNA-specific adenosine deaminase 2 [Clonorchis sinensis]|uniref:tRNA-specific adenosine deaminase 2 n=1 Tax=Clonorchis sinensis TaxID=79923 RepID=A0A3R7H864_CLOSI|nr:tRNA-specific adenosine deaminase 2 [Clonorchis sinensis]